MKRIAIRVVPVVALLVAGVAWLTPRVSGQSGSMPSTKNGDWPMYTADIHGSKYSPLDQINAGNFSKLEVAWRFKTDNLGPRPETKLEGTPVKVGDTVYATAGTRRAVVALNATTGEMKWMYSMDEGERATRWAPRQLSGRGLSYWTDGKGDDRVVYVTTGYRLVSLNAKTGQPIPTFGDKGVIDLKVGVVIGKDKQIDLEKGEIGLHSTPHIVGDVIIVGSSMFEGLGYVYSTNAKGLVRAYDARTGKQLWRFNTIPYPGQFGNETWENGSWEWTGNVGVWTEITSDPEAGLVYLPVETPTIDEYGGNRPGDNLFAESIVAVDIKTGQRKWYYQFVHHPLWDHDMSAWGLVMDVNIDGKPRKVLAVPSKQGWLYVFDRITGQPIWPIEERPVPQSTMHGEKTAKTQPFPTKPAPYSRTHVTENDLIDFTPELRAQALKNLQKFRWEPIPYVPPVGPETDKFGTINIANTTGGVNWPGSGFDPETGIFYTHAHNSAITVAKYDHEEFDKVNPDQFKNKPRLPRWEAEPDYGLRRERPAGGPGGAPAVQFPGMSGRRALVEGLDGLSIMKPPYGVMAAIDVNKGDLMWQVPHGDTPDVVRNNPRLRGMNIPKTGQPGNVGVLITKTLLIAGDPQVTNIEPRGRGAMLRAYDKKTGQQVGEVLLPAPVVGHPMTYSVNGRQYIIVGVSGGNYTGEYIALRAPQTEATPTAPRQ
ncbi:MAG: PQQ-binding-like beta-propeller repeat protein [Vicinamibacterales bacterium]